MSFYIGNKEISSIYIGSKEITDIYLGSQLLYSNYKFVWSFTDNRTASLIGFTYGNTPNIRIPESVFHQGDNYSGNYLVTEIGQGVFMGTSIQNITIPSGILNIGNNAFNDCMSLNNVYYNGTLESWCQIIFESSTSNPIYSANNLYINNTIIGDIVIPNSIKKINNYTFIHCHNLTSVTIHNLVESIGRDSFYWCSNLSNIIFKNGSRLTTIGDFAFSYCINLTSVSLPDMLNTIGQGAFSECSGLLRVNIPIEIDSIGQGAFSGCTNLSICNFDTGGLDCSIGENAFSRCTNLREIGTGDLDRIIYIGNSAYSYCTGIEQVVIGRRTTVGSSVFYNCTGITEVDIECQTISNGCFKGCSNLVKAIITTDVTSIEHFAFDGCTSLTNITYSGTISQWNSISKGYNWNSNTGNYIVHCTNGDIQKS